MENGAIKTIDIKDFKLLGSQLNYIDDDFIVTEDLTNLPYSMDAVRTKFLFIIFCVEGHAQLDINGKTYLLQSHDYIICLPTMILSQIMLSPRYKLRMIGFSTQFLNRIIKKEKGTDNMFYYIYKNPVQHIKEEEKGPLGKYYEALIMAKINNTTHHYRKDILHYLFSAIFCEIMAIIHQYSCNDLEIEPEKEMKQGNLLCHRFMEEVSKDNGMHRTVNYYADILCYSPKYMSSVVKQVSGRTALDWINEYAIEQIKVKLKHSDKSIKEIAESFNFPNQSFFGKYVKAHLGMSPARYRHSKEE
ncbi:MAG: helix-turn-helix domain-containing protein [Bacteroides sp.]|jgi:AraC-like DNA-binding protein|nr:helix-turn-helix domain-containing protein [Bacteroides sp.]MCI1683760.1 helix-turn-helix domain-containing protein [Bacteroides sp.]